MGPLLVTVLTLGLALLYFWAVSRATRYRVTTQRVVIERGLLSKRLDQVDLYRIQDYVVERPFGQRPKVHGRNTGPNSSAACPRGVSIA